MPFLLPWERIVWSGRSGLGSRLRRAAAGGEGRYWVTDFRVLRADRRHADEPSEEIALYDVQRIAWRATRLQRLMGRADLELLSASGASFVLVDIPRRACTRVAAQVLACNPAASVGPGLDAAVIRALHGPRLHSRWDETGHPAPVVGLTPLLVLVTVVIVVIGLQGNELRITYSADDPIYPGGRKRTTAEIVAFMESEVMPFAREALGPLVGGADKVRCETCHGRDGAARGWRMPGVNRLPEPSVRAAGLERGDEAPDAYVRNAIYADLAEDENQPIARYMRSVVMPGMARLLHRPPYDFTRSYRVNRSRAALGCYHCHRVR